MAIGNVNKDWQWSEDRRPLGSAVALTVEEDHHMLGSFSTSVTRQEAANAVMEEDKINPG